MKKLITALFLILLVSIMIGCKAPEEPKLEVEIAEEEIEADIAEIDALEEDLDSSELDELDSLINELG